MSAPAADRGETRRSLLETLDSRRLLYFHEIARLGSFRRTEEALGVAQSALSRQMQALEADLGAVLMVRHGRGVSLTDVGEMVYRDAAEILRGMTRMREMVRRARDDPAGEVRLAVVSTFAATYGTQLVSRLRRAYPGIALKVSEGPTGVVHDWLVDRVADLAVIVGPSPSAALVQHPLLSDTLHLVGAPGEPILEQAEVDIGALRDLPLVLPSTPHGARRLLDGATRRRRIVLRPLIEVDSLALLKQLLISERPIFTILPRLAVRSELAQGLLAAAPLKPRIDRMLMLALRADHQQSRAERTAVAELFAVVDAGPPPA